MGENSPNAFSEKYLKYMYTRFVFFFFNKIRLESVNIQYNSVVFFQKNLIHVLLSIKYVNGDIKGENMGNNLKQGSKITVGLTKFLLFYMQGCPKPHS